MPTTIPFPIQQSPRFRRVGIAAGTPAVESALIMWAAIMLLIAAAANLGAQPLFPDAFQTLAAF